MKLHGKPLRTRYVVLAALGILALSFLCYSRIQSYRATQLAKDYLAQKYQQEMIFKSIYRTWLFNEYYVVFTSAESNIDFRVTIVADQLSNIKKPYQDSDGLIGDNYLSSFFYTKTIDALTPTVTQIFGEDAYIRIYSDYIKLVPHPDFSEVNEHMSDREMEPYFNYTFSITPNILLNNASKEEEAQRILTMFQTIPGLDYHPTEIIVWYQTGNKEDSRKPPSWEGSSKFFVSFENWEEIDSVEQIMTVMDDQWVF